MAIVQYPKTARDQLSPNFRASEFVCRGSGCCDSILIDEALVDYLQKIRDHFAQPVTINSGYRCPTHNQAIGGVNNSRHTKGQAADISVWNVAPAEVARYAESIGVLGIGLYETPQDGYFVHIDTRPYQSFWYGQKEAYRETFGADPWTQFLSRMRLALELESDAGPEAVLAAAPTLGAQWNNRHSAVKPLQQYLSALGYTQVGAADGIAGSMFTAALSQFQTDHGLQPTGIAEQWGKTWHILLQLSQEVSV